MTLDEIIRSKLANGEIEHLTLFKTDGKFMASYRCKGGSGYRVAHHKDPVSALKDVLLSFEEKQEIKKSRLDDIL